MRRGGVLTAVVAVCLASACDPCRTTLSCSGAPSAALLGQIVDYSGTARSNVRIDVTQQGGVALRPGTASTTTQKDGTFELGLAADSAGDALVTVTVSTPGSPSYSIPDVRLRATTRTGAATVLPPWVKDGPTLPFVIVVRVDPSTDVGLSQATVIFRRTSGPRMLIGGVAVATLQGKTDSAGWAFLFRDVVVDAGGSVTGDVVIRSPTKPDSIVVPNISFLVSPQFEPTTTIRFFLAAGL